MILSALMWLSQWVLLSGSVLGGQSFPRPLTKEEEKDALERLKKQDEQARNTLIEHNLRLVAHICKKYAVNGRDVDDLISIGTIGLIKAVQTFDAEKGKSLVSYAARCIENEILMSVRAEKKMRSEVAMSEVVNTDKNGNKMQLADILPSLDADVDEQVQTKMSVKRLYEAIETSLAPREKMIIELRYGLAGGPCQTQRLIAKKLGISRSYVSRIETKALIKLNKAMQIYTDGIERRG
ncbi:MAG: RNA polymerase sporulation sigma factor SigK [Clostridia bacterium]|nr:RNA polymerase sporulation sigma factor SigK [Clostridia bacterium]